MCAKRSTQGKPYFPSSPPYPLYKSTNRTFAWLRPTIKCRRQKQFPLIAHLLLPSLVKVQINIKYVCHFHILFSLNWGEVVRLINQSFILHHSYMYVFFLTLPNNFRYKTLTVFTSNNISIPYRNAA